MELINPNPVLYPRRPTKRRQVVADQDETEREPIDAIEVFEYIRDIRDPEHPYSLEQLNVVREEQITVDDANGLIQIVFTPTVDHCNMASLIGLSLRVQLMKVLPKRFKVDIAVAEKSHVTEAAITKQLNDKERIAAALENPTLMEMVQTCVKPANPSLEGL